MTLYLKLDNNAWFQGDYSSENGITGTVYTDKALTTAKNLTGYTLTIRLFKGDDSYLSKSASAVVAASGTWRYYPAVNEMPTWGLYQIKLELTKSGVLESTLNDVWLNVLRGPTQ